MKAKKRKKENERKREKKEKRCIYIYISFIYLFIYVVQNKRMGVVLIRDLEGLFDDQASWDNIVLKARLHEIKVGKVHGLTFI